MSYVLVLNSGSSSVKFQLVDPESSATDTPLVSGLVEQVGEPSAPSQSRPVVRSTRKSWKSLLTPSASSALLPS